MRTQAERPLAPGEISGLLPRAAVRLLASSAGACPVVALRSGKGPVFGPFYGEAQPPAIVRASAPRSTPVIPDT